MKADDLVIRDREKMQPAFWRIAGYIFLALGAALYAVSWAGYIAGEPKIIMPGGPLIQERLSVLHGPLGVILALSALVLSFLAGVAGTRLVWSMAVIGATALISGAIITFAHNVDFFGPLSILDYLLYVTLLSVPIGTYLIGYGSRVLFLRIRK